MRKRLLFLSLALVPKATLAHCPLCTIGAGALAILAASLGVSSVVVGILIGAFALALGLWISNLIKKQYIPYQKIIFLVIVSLSTVIPIAPLVQDYGPLYLPFMGSYGATYAINLYVLGVIIGSAIMFVSPSISKFVTRFRRKPFPFQGISITVALLIVISVIVQLLS